MEEVGGDGGWRRSYLGFLAKVGRELEAGDGALVVAHDDDGVDGVELDVRQHGLLPGHHHLLADGLVLVDAEVKHVHLQAGEGRRRSGVECQRFRLSLSRQFC